MKIHEKAQGVIIAEHEKKPVTPQQIVAAILAIQQIADEAAVKYGWSARVIELEDEGARFKRYRRIIKTGPGQNSIYCFVDMMTGDLLTGDLLTGGWKAPAKNGVRGNLNDPNWPLAFDWFGAKSRWKHICNVFSDNMRDMDSHELNQLSDVLRMYALEQDALLKSLLKSLKPLKK
jgi:hypothetical protein